MQVPTLTILISWILFVASFLYLWAFIGGLL